MKNNNNLNSSGYTLVEIVIVMAIGALLVGASIAASALAQRDNRDRERRAHAENLMADLGSYYSENFGRTPYGDASKQTSFINDYGWGSPLRKANPSGGAYTIEWRSTKSLPVPQDTIHIIAPNNSSKDRDYYVCIGMETRTDTYCTNPTGT